MISKVQEFKPAKYTKHNPNTNSLSSFILLSLPLTSKASKEKKTSQHTLVAFIQSAVLYNPNKTTFKFTVHRCDWNQQIGKWSDQHQSLMGSSLTFTTPFHQVSKTSVLLFLCNLAHKPTNQPKNKRTGVKTQTSLAETKRNTTPHSLWDSVWD